MQSKSRGKGQTQRLQSPESTARQTLEHAARRRPRATGEHDPAFARVDAADLDAGALLAALRLHGFVVLTLPPNVAALNREVLGWFRRFAAQPAARKDAFALAADHGTGEHNGYHRPGGLSAYNRFREGYIFQADEPIWHMLEGPDGALFADAHERWRAAIHRLGYAVMEEVAVALGLDRAHFGAGGPCDICTSAQFHLKAVCRNTEEAPPPTAEADGRTVAMPAHRDPSVISLVSANGPGLQVFIDSERQYIDVPTFGPDVCTVIAGQILTKVTRGLVNAPMHRVVSEPGALERAERVAGTFFFQPPLDAVLRPLDSAPVRQHVLALESNAEQPFRRWGDGGAAAKSFTPITFRDWKARAFKSYYKRNARAPKSEVPVGDDGDPSAVGAGANDHSRLESDGYSSNGASPLEVTV
ncbi:hypothetical protein T492DRAFT_848888 [Pavlovales sp. CCMP2436]|nr:hypothetical protein T492DRAFT_848888 [Pavlovales sp. CCMP2436]